MDETRDLKNKRIVTIDQMIDSTFGFGQLEDLSGEDIRDDIRA